MAVLFRFECASFIVKSPPVSTPFLVFLGWPAECTSVRRRM